MKHARIQFVGLLLLTVSPVWAVSFSDLPEREIRYVNKKTGELHARARLLVKRVEKDDRDRYVIVQTGQGNYDTYKDVHWVKASKIIYDGLAVKPLESITTVYDPDKTMRVEYRKLYDYENKEIVFKKLSPERKVLEREVFPIDGPTCDDVTLVHFLRGYAEHKGEKDYEQFFLLTNEPKLYKVRIKELPAETLDLESGRVRALKFQLMTELGPLSELAAKLIPPTFVWYTDTEPYDWLQYEGLETTLRSANIVVSVMDSELNTGE